MADLAFSWDVRLMALSYLNACVGAWVALNLIKESRYHGRNRSTHLFFSFISAVCFGLCGIWTMHFIGMLAFKVEGTIITYNVGLVVLSGIVAVLTVFVGFYYVITKIIGDENNMKSDTDHLDSSKLQIVPRIHSFTKNDIIHCVVSGIIVGVGVGGMHYIGMVAVIIDAGQVWIWWIIILSFVIAMTVATVGLFLLSFFDGTYGQIICAAIIGFAVCSMHYVGMYGTIYQEQANVNYGNVNKELQEMKCLAYSFIISATSLLICFILNEIVRLKSQHHRRVLRKMVSQLYEIVIDERNNIGINDKSYTFKKLESKSRLNLDIMDENDDESIQLNQKANGNVDAINSLKKNVEQIYFDNKDSVPFVVEFVVDDESDNKQRAGMMQVTNDEHSDDSIETDEDM